MGSWNDSLYWKADEEIEMSVNPTENTFTFSNLTLGTEVKFTFNEGSHLSEKEWFFVL